MIDEFPTHQQQTNWSCFPTAVLSVLEYLGRAGIRMDQVADWCQVLSGGACRWDESVRSLRSALQEEQGVYDVISVEGDWDALREAVEENDEPVIVSIANPSPQAEFVAGHAVVVIRFEASDDGQEYVVYMDPATGSYERKSADEFLDWWDMMDRLGFLFRP